MIEIEEMRDSEAREVLGTLDYAHLAVAKDNIFAVQFHPEKSHAAGLALLDNFVRWKPV